MEVQFFGGIVDGENRIVHKTVADSIYTILDYLTKFFKYLAYLDNIYQI